MMKMVMQSVHCTDKNNHFVEGNVLSASEEVGRGWPLWNKLRGVIANWLLYLNRKAFLALTEKGLTFKIKI